MNKPELVEYIASYADLSQEQASEALDATITGIIDALAADEQVVLLGLGTFLIRERAARTVVSPDTGEEIDLRSKKIVHFRSDKALEKNIAETVEVVVEYD